MIDRLSIPLGAVDCSRVNEEDGHPVSHADELNPPFAVDAPVSRRPQVVQLGRDCGVSGRITGVGASPLRIPRAPPRGEAMRMPSRMVATAILVVDAGADATIVTDWIAEVPGELSELRSTLATQRRVSR